MFSIRVRKVWLTAWPARDEEIEKKKQKKTEKKGEITIPSFFTIVRSIIIIS